MRGCVCLGIVTALMASGCAQAGAGGTLDPNVGGGGGGGAADLAGGGVTAPPDLARFCGDGVCASDEACDACPADCGACPPCPAGTADCNHDRGDGCETNAGADPGEPGDDRCPGQASSTGEGASSTLSGNRILPAGDTDTFAVHLSEGSHTCVPLSSQSFAMRIDLTPPSGTDLRLRYNTGSCDDTWTDSSTTFVCLSWSGTCGLTDDRDYWFQVYGSNDANSCADYSLVVTFANEGDSIAGCP